MPPNDPETNHVYDSLPQVDPTGGYETPPQQPTKPKNTKLIVVIIAAVVFVVILLGVSLLASKGGKKTDTSSTPTTTSNTNNYTFTAPEGWTMDKTAQSGAKVSYAKSNGSDLTDSTLAIIESSADGSDLDAFQSVTTSSLKSALPDLSEQSSKDVQLGSTPARLVLSSYSLGDTDMDCLQLFAIKNGTAYSILVMTPDETWSSDQAAVTEAVLSFRP